MGTSFCIPDLLLGELNHRALLPIRTMGVLARTEHSVQALPEGEAGKNPVAAEPCKI
jgi:hypothetical protein